VNTIPLQPTGHFPTQAETHALAHAYAQELLKEENSLELYIHLKAVEQLISDLKSEIETHVFDAAFCESGGATGKFDFKGVEVQLKNKAPKYEYTGAVLEMENAVKTKQEEIKALKKYEEKSGAATMVQMPGMTIAISFRKGDFSTDSDGMTL